MNIEMTKSVARRVALVAAASALMEVAAKLPAWIEGMSPASRKAYLKAHPDSKYASQLGGSAKPAAKPKGGAVGDSSPDSDGSDEYTAEEITKMVEKRKAAEQKKRMAALRAKGIVPEGETKQAIKENMAAVRKLKASLPESIETRADKAKATRINNKIKGLMDDIKAAKADLAPSKTPGPLPKGAPRLVADKKTGKTWIENDDGAKETKPKVRIPSAKPDTGTKARAGRTPVGAPKVLTDRRTGKPIVPTAGGKPIKAGPAKDPVADAKAKFDAFEKKHGKGNLPFPLNDKRDELYQKLQDAKRRDPNFKPARAPRT